MNQRNPLEWPVGGDDGGCSDVMGDFLATLEGLPWLDGATWLALAEEAEVFGAATSLAPIAARLMCGQLWGCRQRLPEGYAARLRMPPGSTYADAVRRLARNLPTRSTGFAAIGADE